ncbi:MAG: type II toxin-antitoxin system VapC family toxin [Rubrivivax sp.]
MLDTNIASFAIRGANDALQSRLGAHAMSALCLSAITEAELLVGLAKRPQARTLKIAVQEFLQLVEVLAWDSKAADAYGTLRATLERQNTPLSNLDTLIAAHAIAAGCVLVSNDKALARTPGLRVEDWSVA